MRKLSHLSLLLVLLAVAIAFPAAAYDQRNIRAWEGLYGVTGGYQHNGGLVVYSQDKFWVNNGGWVDKGFLGQRWGTAPPAIDLNPAGQSDPRLKKRPWNYPGVTAAFFKDNPDDLHIVQRSRYWRYNFTTGTWVTAGFLKDLFPGAPAVGGRYPWDGPGVTGAWNHGNIVRLGSKDRYWKYDLAAGAYTDAGYLSTIWSNAPIVDGQRLYEGPGVTGAYIRGNVITLFSVNRFWNFDYVTNSWIRSGYVSNVWTDMPGIDARWSHPIGGDAVDRWRITNPVGGCSSFGCGHLGEDLWRVEGADTSVGQSISAAAQGKVVIVRDTCGSYYNVVAIEHMVPDINDDDAPIYSFYGHVTVASGLREGDWVNRGQIIGTLPDPRNAHGFPAHVHFEVKNWFAHINGPFSTCTIQSRGWYISAGYDGPLSGVAERDYYDLPRRTGDVHVRRYYGPTRFCELRGGGPRPSR